MQSKLNFDAKTMLLLIRQIGYVDTFHGGWLTIEERESRYLRQLRYVATIESTGSSTRIEGATLSDDEVRELLDAVKITQLRTRDEQEVVGYFECLDTILDNYGEIRLTENYILQLHNILLRYSEKDHRHRGTYKNLPNKVVANYPGGKQSVIFNTTEPHLVKKEMETLIEWTNKAFDEGELHPLLITGTFVYEFLSIHPFQDGNGRLSRLLTTLLLLRSGYLFVQYVAFESLIEERKTEYYKALMAGQKDRYTENERIGKWLVFFLDCLSSLVRKLELKYDTYNRKGTYLKERQQQLIGMIKKAQPVRLGDVAKAFPATSPNTLKKDLAYLVNEHVLGKTGKGKGTSYYVMEEK
jgi:Fic family protein